jgi:hypothetical protein
MTIRIVDVERGCKTSPRWSFFRDSADGWIDCMEEYLAAVKVRLDVDEFPFWYGERPLIGFLDAAVWRAGGITIQEYGIDKKPGIKEPERESRLGRADFFFSVGKHFADVEFKLHSIGISRGRNFRPMLRNKMKVDRIDAVRGHQRGLPSCVGMFLRPYTPSDVGEREDWARYTRNFQRFLIDVWDALKPDVLAWWFPVDRVLNLPPKRKKEPWAVGVMLVIKQVSR